MARKIVVRVSLAKFRDAAGLSKTIRSAARKALFEMARDLGRSISREMPEDTRALRRSIRIETKTAGDAAAADIKTAFYGRFQHEGFGGKGKFPPPGVLTGWIRRKIGPGVRKQTRKSMAKRLKGKGKEEKKRLIETRVASQLKGIEFLVARKIAKIGGPGRGVKRPNRFINRALDRDGARLREEFFQKIVKAVGK